MIRDGTKMPRKPPLRRRKRPPAASPILARIDRRLTAVGKSRTGVLNEAGLKPDVLRDLERRSKGGPRVEVIKAIAPALETTPEWLAFEVGPETAGACDEPRNARRIVIQGEVAAGLWLEIDAFREELLGELPFAADPQYPVEAQYALGVKGTSINRVARPGDYLLCLDLGLSGIEPSNGDLVIVERRRAQGGEKEVTAKRFHRNETRIELLPDSDDPRWQEPIMFHFASQPDDEEIAVVALVTGVFRSARAWRRP